MGPCPVCGNMAVDPAGYCTRCRTYRGPAYQPYPPAPPPAPPRKMSLAPLIAAAAAGVILIAAIIVVVIVKSGRHGTPLGGGGGGGGSSASTSPSPTSLVDPCVVGTWKVTSDQRVVDFGGSYGKITVTSADPYTVTLRADGTGVDDLGKATAFQSEVNGTIYTVAFNGTDTYSYRTANGQITYSGSVAKGRWVTLVDTKEVGSGSTVANNDPVQYTCSGDTMTEKDDNGYSAQFSRTSHST